VSLPSERTMPILDARPERGGYRITLPGNTTAWLPTIEDCRVVARQYQAALRIETETELRAAYGDR
jgi:hypothetical protein